MSGCSFASNTVTPSARMKPFQTQSLETTSGLRADTFSRFGMAAESDRREPVVKIKQWIENTEAIGQLHLRGYADWLASNAQQWEKTFFLIFNETDFQPRHSFQKAQLTQFFEAHESFLAASSEAAQKLLAQTMAVSKQQLFDEFPLNRSMTSYYLEGLADLVSGAPLQTFQIKCQRDQAQLAGMKARALVAMGMGSPLELTLLDQLADAQLSDSLDNIQLNQELSQHQYQTQKEALLVQYVKELED
ncbi:MAG: hypothetical protein SFZ03_07365 [Candidatus Melainabacteria bacterium]|nr:hypothetical protein [Candidatus Melainabacteria bacterium]